MVKHYDHTRRLPQFRLRVKQLSCLLGHLCVSEALLANSGTASCPPLSGWSALDPPNAH